MEPKKKIFVVNRPGSYTYSIPLLWASAKTYYEERSNFINDWEWGDPNLDYENPDQLIENLIKSHPTIVAFSVYIWNERFSTDMARLLKEKINDLTIIWGGPQCDIHYNNDFFKQYPFIDLVVPSDAYGEQSFLDILDNISKNNKLQADQIQYCYYPGPNRDRKFNSLSPNKREFLWPKNPYRAQDEYLGPFINNLSNYRSWLTIETSRGCPYKCSFCDWGGGTFTKTVKKDFSTVLDEISWAGEHKFDAISFTDANFGIFPIDIEYIKHCVETKKKYGFPKQILIQPTKTKIDQLTKIYLMLAQADMLSHYQIAIQDINDEVKKNVDRIDFPFENQVRMFKELQKIKNLPIWIESILGLPGSSVETVKTGIQAISIEKLSYPLSHHWAMLPATPAADPQYREKYKLITVKGKSSNGVGGTRVIKAKSNMPQDLGVTVANNFDDVTGEYVVGSFSYTPDDWIDMNMLQLFTASMQNSDILSLIANYLWDTHKILYGDFFNNAINHILYDSSVDKTLQNDFYKLKLKFQEWIDTDLPDLYVDGDKELNFMLAPAVYFLYVGLLNIDALFDAVLKSISKLITVDEIIKDLCLFSKNRIIDIEYNPGKTFTTKYDWNTYLQSGKINKKLTKYTLRDTEIFTGGRLFDIDWMPLSEHEKKKQYFYRVCYDFKSSKIVKNIDYQ